MANAILSTLFVLLTCSLAYRANRWFRGEARLPMQWGLAGNVNWSAPRAVALAFMPILTGVMLGFVTILSMTVPPRAGQEHLVLPVTAFIGTTLVATQLIHFWLIRRTLR
mgnify:CR=1 FL=1